MALEDAEVAREDAEEALKALDLGTAKFARAQREVEAAAERAIRLTAEMRRRTTETEFAAFREREIAARSQEIADHFLGRALARLRKTEGLEPWQLEAAARKAKELHETPWEPGMFGAGFQERVRGIIAAEIDAKHEAVQRTAAANGGRYASELGSGDYLRDLADKVGGDAPDHMDGSFVAQLANAMLPL
jgi:hypothetical protein